MMVLSIPRAAIASICAVVLAGCASMAPTYERPALPVAEQFHNTMVGDSSAAPLVSLPWRQVFLDPRLQRVISLALNNNRDLRVAMLNIEKARAEYRIQRSDLLPSVDVAADRSAQRSSVASTSGGISQVSHSASIEVGFTNWELDLFGRIRSLKDEALETWLATTETQRSTRMSLIAEVAGDWLAVAAYQQLLALAQQTHDNQGKTLALTERKHALGAASGVDLASVQGSMESARADVAQYKSALEQARNALELVVGTSLESDLLPGPDGDTEAVMLAPLSENLSSQVLLERPDVLYAEHALKAANANIGAARAAFFPAVTLTASAGRSAGSLSGLFENGGPTWAFLPSLSVPIFNAGALKAELDVAKISKNIYVAQYEQAIQTAFREVADALAERAHVGEQLDAQRAYLDAARRSYELADARWRNGLDSYLETLTAQRSYYAAQQDLISLSLSEATNRVTLYKVLGGGADATALEPDESI